MTTQSYQLEAMNRQMPIAYFFLQQYEFSRHQLTIFNQISSADESLQMTLNPFCMDGPSITSFKPLMVFTGTYSECSVEDYLNAVTANTKNI